MKEWREVFGTEAEQPEEFDTTASPTTVYQRRNIKKATKEDADGKKITGWQREEREMSREEYDRLTLMQEVVASNTTGIVIVFVRVGAEPSTLTENVFRFLSVEGGAMALIKSVKTVTKKDTGKQHENEPDDINADNNEEVQG